jgi:MFS family permease
VISLPAIPIYVGYASVAIGIVAGVVYMRHAKRVEYPILDPKLFKLPLFRSAIVGGSLFRIGIGAFPFLMPLMLQLAFGLNPFESGLITFITAFGAIVSKVAVQPLFRTFGFPRTLVLLALIGCAFLAINGLFMPNTPHWVLMVALFGGGLIRSFFFTGLNALVFADVDESQASQATAINAVAQQLSIAAGVAVAGGTLEFTSNLMHGGTLTLTDFHIAWFVVALFSILSALPFLRLPPDAGSDVSGHKVKPMPRSEPAPL